MVRLGYKFNEAFAVQVDMDWAKELSSRTIDTQTALAAETIIILAVVPLEAERMRIRK